MNHVMFSKLAWISEASLCVHCTQLLEQALSSCANTEASTTATAANASTSVENDIDFSILPRVLQLHHHRHTWSSSTEHKCPMFDKHPVIKQLSVRYNTCLPSSASDDRLFSTFFCTQNYVAIDLMTICLKP